MHQYEASFGPLRCIIICSCRKKPFITCIHEAITEFTIDRETEIPQFCDRRCTESLKNICTADNKEMVIMIP